MEWKKVQREIEDEHAKLGFACRFGAGLPRINDGSFLFLQHMISKLMRPEDGGGRLAIVFNGSPLFTGGAGSGESEIRRWIIENDRLEGIVALPDQLWLGSTACHRPFVPMLPTAWARCRRPSTRPSGRRSPSATPRPRPLEEIDAEIRALEEEIQRLLREVTTLP